jgi:hypothetical protein
LDRQIPDPFLRIESIIILRMHNTWKQV